MFTPTNNLEDQISFMDPYPTLLSPFTCFEIDGYNIPNYYHDESVVLAQPQAESSHEPISASSKMDVNHGENNGIVEQDNSRGSNHGSINKQQIPRRKSSKADRHSKIPTAQGLRDRRMRLSLDVARQFFKLQDMLSYDKPSQTIKWLLLQAEPAIDELKETDQSPITNGGKGASSTSEVEDVVENTVCDKIGKATSSKEKCKQTRKNAFNPEAKDMRKKARERARERTQKKKQASMLIEPRRYVEIEEDSVSQSQDMRPSLDVLYRIEQQIEDERIPFGIPYDFTSTSLVLSSNWSQLMSLNYHQEDQTCQFKPIQEFQFQGASWEPYSHPYV